MATYMYTCQHVHMSTCTYIISNRLLEGTGDLELLSSIVDNYNIQYIINVCVFYIVCCIWCNTLIRNTFTSVSLFSDNSCSK